MSCCGRGRSLQRPFAAPARPIAGPRAASGAPARAAAAPAAFEYAGPGAIAVTGPMTGATYRFAGPGARVAVHVADAPSLIGVPGLKPIR